MKNLILTLFSVLSFSLFGLAQQYQYANSGMQFRFLHDEPGKNAEIGELISMDMLIKSSEGTVIKSTYKDGKPILFPVKFSAFEGDIYEAVRLLSKGDSAEFLISADSMFAKTFRKPMPSSVKPGTNLSVTIAAHEIYTQQEYFAMQQEKQKKYEEVHKSEIEALYHEEAKQLEAYFTANFGEFFTSPSGVLLAIKKQGVGDKPVKGEAVVFEYKGYFLDGKVFESSDDEGMHPMSFTLGNNEVIPGLEEAFSQISLGSKAVIGIPSHLAYGRKGKGAVPPNTVVIFEVYFMTKN